MNGLATVVACYGSFANSPAVVIGAMIIAMLLGPIAGVSLAVVDLDNALLRRALPTLLGGFLVVYGTAFLLGLIHRDLPLTDEIYARTAPNLMDILIALGGGAAGAYSMIAPRLSVAFVGVAIATALVPPLSASALCLARGEYELAFERFSWRSPTSLGFSRWFCRNVAGRLSRTRAVGGSAQHSETKSSERCYIDRARRISKRAIAEPRFQTRIRVVRAKASDIGSQKSQWRASRRCQV